MTLPQTPLRFISKFIYQQWIKFSLLATASIVWAINDVLLPYYLKQIVNVLQAHTLIDRVPAVDRAFWMIVFLWCVSELFLRLRGIVEIYAYPVFRGHIRERVFQYTLSHAYRYFAENFAGTLSKKLNELPNSCLRIVEMSLLDFLTAAFGGCLVLVLFWLTQPIFAAILFFWLSFHLGITYLFLRLSAPLLKAHAKAVSMLSGKMLDVLGNLLSVRLFSRNRYELMRLKCCQLGEMAQARRAMLRIEMMRLCLGLNSGLFILGLLAILLYGWRQGWTSLGDFTQITMQAFWLMQWAWFVSFQLSVFAREYGIVDEALSLIRQPHELVDHFHIAKPLILSRGEIHFEAVSFAYQPHTPIFQDLNVHIPAGQKVGLVGVSGSGKSTLIHLLLRLYDPQSGQIVIDGQCIKEITQDSLHRQIAMVPQDPVLFHRSLMENIRYGRLEASDEEVVHAAKQSHCHEFIEQLPQAYQTLVGDRGAKLSGGQRQRIAIARAFLKKAPILILDEATSALDSATEVLIYEALQQLMQGTTSLIIAHRLSTLSGTDRLLVFHQGCLLEDGPKNRLLKAGGHFAMLWRKQADGFLYSD